MALFLRSTRPIHNFIVLSCRRVVTVRRKWIFMSRVGTGFRLDEFLVRTAVSLAQTESNISHDLEHSMYQLSNDVRFGNILMEDVRKIFNALKGRGEMTDPEMLLFLKCCSKVSFLCSPEERIEFAQEIWSTAINFGKKLDISHYNALLSVFLENNFKFSYSEFLQAVKENGLEPNLVTYQRILKAYCQQGDIDGASGFLEQMKQLDFPLGETDFNALIQCHCIIGDFDKARGIISVMKDNNIDPTSHTFLHFLCGYAKHGRIDQLKQLLDDLYKSDVSLSDEALLEVIFTLAINNYNEHVDMILEKLSSDYKNIKNMSRVIQRLLHNKLDSVAFKVFEIIEKDETLDHKLAHSKYILKHFALYRDPYEALNICREFDKKGSSMASLGYTLRQVFLHKDEEYCLDFLHAMADKSMPLRSHYFWPALIKASQKGNQKMLQILDIMPKDLMKSCQYTTTKIVFPNYKFSDNWITDYDKLARTGLCRKWLSVCFMEKLLLEDKFEEVENLVSRHPVDLERYNHVLNILIDYVQTNPKHVERFIKVLYYLGHDYYLIFPGGSFKDYYGPREDISSKSIFDVATIVFLRIMLIEDVFRQVLQHMLEKKFGITPEVASLLRKSGKVNDIDDLLDKLADPELGAPDYDKELLTLKSVDLKSRRFRRGRLGRNSKDRSPQPNRKKEVDGDLWQDSEVSLTYEKTIHIIRGLIRKMKYQEANQLVKRLAEPKESDKHQKSEHLFMNVLIDFIRSKQYELAEKAFHQGVVKGILKSKNYIRFLRRLARFNTPLAVEKYCKLLEKDKPVLGQLEFLIKAVGDENESNIRKISSALSERLTAEHFCTYLFIALVENRKLKEAKKLLETSEVKLLENPIYTHLIMKFKSLTSEKLEGYLACLSVLNYFNRTPLYKLALKKYAEEQNLAKITKLWLLIEEDYITDCDFLEKIRELMNDLSLKKLSETTSSIVGLPEKSRKVRNTLNITTS